MMRVRYLIGIGVFILSIFGGLAWSAFHYSEKAAAAEHDLKLANDTINDMTVRQRKIATLDAKYTGELADAKKQLEDLQRCVSTGKCGLHINATCPKNGTTSAPGVDDGSTARLTDAAERDYWRLRERITTITKQLTGLQAYVREQCQ
ncbi:Bacteriophage lysis protein [Phytobacter ursingii]|nr:Bacteriophage lysis protein [Phytobacter ursingii]